MDLSRNSIELLKDVYYTDTKEKAILNGRKID